VTISSSKGTKEDSVWIVSLLQQGANDGHFYGTVAKQADALLTELYKNGVVSMMKLRDGALAYSFVNMSISVADINNKPAAFIVSISEENEIEIHLAGTRKEFRRSGCFTELVKHEIKRHPSTVKIFSRCYKKSTWAVTALKKLGFQITKNGDPAELTLIRK
jgi:hypothetical protein